MEKIKDYFKRYPLSNEVYECGGVLFHDRGAAESFGKGDVTKHTRESVMAEVKVDDDKKTPEEEKAAAVATLKAAVDLTAVPYAEQKALVKTLGLEVADQKGDTLLAALAAFKETLKAE